MPEYKYVLCEKCGDVTSCGYSGNMIDTPCRCVSAAYEHLSKKDLEKATLRTNHEIRLYREIVVLEVQNAELKERLENIKKTGLALLKNMGGPEASRRAAEFRVALKGK